MPLVRIDLPATLTPQAAIVGDCVHRAMVASIGVPLQDRFQVITTHSPSELIYDPSYLGIARSAGFLAIQITLNTGRTVPQKQALYSQIVALLAAEVRIRPEDVLISLVEVAKENWSFGNGIAQYA
jgi:phenylpyruvate tautomerase PptA (4-oxalocrotonate tautomerase family)